MKVKALTIGLLISHIVHAQHPSTVFIKAGDLVSDVLTPAIQFLYPAFIKGHINFKDSSGNDARLNYNLCNGEIMYISPAGDTLALAKEQMVGIKSVTIDTNSFIYHQGYLQIVLKNAEGSLAKKQQYVVKTREKIGGYGTAASTSAIDSYSTYNFGTGNIQNLSLRENITLQLKTRYFFGDAYNLYLPATRKNLEKLFFKKRTQLDNYFKEHRVNFQNEDDLKDLFLQLTK